MTDTISAEMFWLAANVILTAAMVLPYAIYRIGQLGGLWQAFLTPLPGDAHFAKDWAHRAYRAHMNAFEGMALFAPAVLAIEVTSIGTAATATASALFFWARLIYVPMYYFTVPVVRTAIWFIGFGATIYLAAIVISRALQ